MDNILESAEIMKLLGMGAAEFDMPGRFSKLQEVINYFGTQNKSALLRVIMQHPQVDALDAAWRYSRLQSERVNAIREILAAAEEQPIAEDISQELQQGILTMNATKRLREDIGKKRSTDIRTTVFEKEEKEKLETSAMVGNAMPMEKIAHQLNIVEEINGALSYYGN